MGAPIRDPPEFKAKDDRPSEPPRDPPAAIVVLTDGVYFLPEGYAAGSMDQTLEAVFLPVKCPTCGMEQIIELDNAGDEVIEKGENQMGNEVVTFFRSYSVCRGCETELEAGVDLSEYPIGSLGAYNLEGEQGTRVVHIGGLKQLVGTLRRVSPFSWSLRNELEELREIIHYIGDQAPTLAGTLSQLLKVRGNSVAVFGSYKSEHRVRLQDIHKAVVAEGREGIVTDQIPKAKGDYIRDASRLVAAVSQLTILYDREASGANNEVEMIVQLERPLAILREKNHHGSSRMLDGLPAKHTFVRIFHIDPDLRTAVREILNWADGLARSWERETSGSA